MSIGEQFSYQGAVYTKAGPISASAELDGKSRMIPRSAKVKLSNSVEADEGLTTDEILIPSVDVVVSNYHHQCLECLALVKGDVSQKKFDDITAKLNLAHQKLLNSFNKN